MTEINYYTVTQRRSIRVAANSAIDAARIADAVLSYTSSEAGDMINSGIQNIWGHTTSKIREEALDVEREY